MDQNAVKRSARNCLFGEAYPSIPYGKVVIGCTEDNIWCNDCIAEKCEMYVDKNDADNHTKE